MDKFENQLAMPKKGRNRNNILFMFSRADDPTRKVASYRCRQRKRTNDLSIFPWNKRSSYREEVANELADIRSQYKTGLRWAKTGFGENYTIYYIIVVIQQAVYSE